MNILIVGLGLIGGSIGRSIIKNTSHTVLGRDISEEVIIKAKLLKAINKEVTDSDYKNVDMLIVATNPLVACDIIDEISPKLKDGAIVLDCCGTKRVVVEKMKELAKKYPKLHYFGGHPMAGREYSTIAHSTINLLDKAFFLVVPINADIVTLSNLKQFILSLGCQNMVVTTAEKHDEIISYTSELAHIVSSAYIKNPLSQKHVGYSAGSFRDMTRVAKINSDMWPELMIENKDNLVEQIDDIILHLQEYKQAISSSDAEKLKQLLKEGNDLKEQAEKLRKVGVNND